MTLSRIFLIGYMGSGKTTIGMQLAKALNMQFLDLDNFIENRYMKTVRDIFTEKGEDTFRNMEHNALKEVVNFENIIISTGGGVPCFYQNMELMNASGLTVYLKVSVNELAKRLNVCKQNRPLIKDKNSEELITFIASALEKRNVFYNQAKLIFDAEKMLSCTDVDNIVCNLTKLLLQNNCT